MRFNKKSIALEENRRSQATIPTIMDSHRDESFGKLRLVRNQSALKLPLNLKLKRKNSISELKKDN